MQLIYLKLILLKFFTKRKFCNRKINIFFAGDFPFNVWVITSMSSKRIIIFLSFCWEVCQNKHFIGPSLSKSCFPQEVSLLNAFLPFRKLVKYEKLLRNLRFITGLWPLSFLFTKNKLFKNSPRSPRPPRTVEFHFSSVFPIPLNLFLTFPLGSSLLIREDHTEMGFRRQEFWYFVQWTKYTHLDIIFPNFPNKILVFLQVEPTSLWHGKGFWSKDVLLTCLNPEVVECWG